MSQVENLKRFVIRSWCRDGFVAKGSVLSRAKADVLQTIGAEIHNDKLQVSFGLSVDGVPNIGSSEEASVCHIIGYLGHSIKASGLAPQDQTERLSADREAARKWADMCWRQVLKPFFDDFCDSGSVRKLVESGDAENLKLLVTRNYRAFLGERVTGRWHFSMPERK